MNTPTVPKGEQRRLRAHFAFTALPFRNNVASNQMFDSFPVGRRGSGGA